MYGLRRWVKGFLTRRRETRPLHPGLETLLLPADPAYIYLSSTVAREMIHYHQPLDKYLPKAILPLIRDWTEQR